MERIFFIVNPIAGSGKCYALFDEAKAILNDKNVPYSAEYTEYAGHAVKIAEEAVKRGEKFIVAVGGDGTVNEITSVLCGNKNIKFGILPFGTGNDISSFLNIPFDTLGAVDALIGCEAREMDMGVANDHTFINVAGFGFDVDVLLNTEKHKKGRKGMMPYLLGIIDAIFHRRKIHAVIETKDKKFEEDILFAVVGNGTQFGGGMKVTPNAKPDDGYFDICVVKYVSFLYMLKLLPSFLKGKHIGKKGVIDFREKFISFKTDVECLIQLDGEIMKGTPVEYRIIPNALKVVRP